MKRATTLLLSVLLVLIMLPACEEPEPEEPPAPPPPPPPSAEQLRNEAVGNLNVLERPRQMSSQQVRQEVNDVKARLRTEVNGDRALRLITSDVVDALRDARDAAREAPDAQRWRWEAVLRLCDALEVLDPTDTVRLRRYREEAETQLRKPQVNLTGFFRDETTGEELAFVNVFLPEKNETESMTIREGDEFHDMRFMQIIGTQRGIRLQYLPTGEVIDVMRRE